MVQKKQLLRDIKPSCVNIFLFHQFKEETERNFKCHQRTLKFFFFVEWNLLVSLITSVKKVICINKNPAFLQAFEHVISMFTTAQKCHLGRATSDVTPETGTRTWTSGLASRAAKTFLGYLWFQFYQKRTWCLSERTVSSTITIRSLATIWTAAKYHI